MMDTFTILEINEMAQEEQSLRLEVGFWGKLTARFGLVMMVTSAMAVLGWLVVPNLSTWVLALMMPPVGPAAYCLWRAHTASERLRIVESELRRVNDAVLERGQGALRGFLDE